MSDEKMVTERDAVLRERVAYVHGMIRGSAKEFSHVAQCEDAARKAYPLPKVTQPRVVVDPHIFGVEWHVVNDRVLENRRVVSGVPYPWFCFDHGGGIADHWRPTTRRIAIWADLLATPTEEVDGE